MNKPTSSIELGKKDAERFISEERIDYEPFIAISDMHMVRKTFAVTYESLSDTVKKLDPELLSQIESSAAELAQKEPESFNHDQYADGFSEGVAAVWDKIRDKVL